LRRDRLRENGPRRERRIDLDERFEHETADVRFGGLRGQLRVERVRVADDVEVERRRRVGPNGRGAGANEQCDDDGGKSDDALHARLYDATGAPTA
jgi:hypothetical protein